MNSFELSPVIGLLLVSILLAAGQILFKITALDLEAEGGFSLLAGLVRSPYAWAAVILYGGATVLWVFLLKTVPLSTAYPFVALGFVLVPAAAAMLFDEPLSGRYILGVSCILIGIYLTFEMPSS